MPGSYNRYLCQHRKEIEARNQYLCRYTKEIVRMSVFEYLQLFMLMLAPVFDFPVLETTDVILATGSTVEVLLPIILSISEELKWYEADSDVGSGEWRLSNNRYLCRYIKEIVMLKPIFYVGI